VVTLFWRPLGRKLDGPQSRSGRCGIEESLDPAWNLIPVALPVAVPTELSRLPYSKKEIFQKAKKILCHIGNLILIHVYLY
jgi:hypothetical protein